VTTDAIVVAARRTPFGRVGAALRDVRAETLVASVVRAVLDDAKVEAEAVDEVIVGNAAGGYGNIARLGALTAGLPISVPAYSVDRQCGAGLQAIVSAAHAIRAGAAEICVAGGVESPSTAYWRVERPRESREAPRFVARAPFAPPQLGDPEMGIAAENVARRWRISRERADRFALRSHRHADRAYRDGTMQAELAALDGAPGLLERDESIRCDTSLEALARLPAAFLEGGSVTAGNACPVNDGAAAVVLVSERVFSERGFRFGLRVTETAAAGVDPNVLGIGPVDAARKLLARAALSIDAFDLVELNEAFAAQVLACADELGIDEARLNVDGGALAIGHPYGASGAALVVRLLRLQRARREARRSLALIGIAGGLGAAVSFEAVGA
jgi:acetyl-CoA C-acetyltransferase